MILELYHHNNSIMYLIIDVETTGLPDRQGLPYGTTPDYTDLERYSSARIVQFTAMLCDSNLEQQQIIDLIIKADDFKIENSDFHGITNEISQEKGVPFQDAITALTTLLPQCTHIIAHNIEFDINVIKSELFRTSNKSLINEIESKKLFCTMQFSKPIVAIRNKYGFKYPSLAELYMHVFETQMQNAHNSLYDVINLHKIVKKLYEDGVLMKIC